MGFIFIWRQIPSSIPREPHLYFLWKGVKHGDELEFTFGHPLSRHTIHNYTVAERLLSLKMIKYFTDFAKTGYIYEYLKFRDEEHLSLIFFMFKLNYLTACCKPDGVRR